ncbi:MAG: SpoIIE family protein phosphatase [Acidobacteria bacterium]|nr:SpoIIE family protein phosphatase [Acidobacteriota bacterium]
MFRLLVVSGSDDPFERKFDCESLTIGRSTKAGLTLPDKYLSREHARIELREGALVVEDLGSRNGTFVNEVRIEEPTPIFPGDCIRVSESRVTLDAPRGAAEARKDQAEPVPERAAFEAGVSLLVPASDLAAERFVLDATILAGGDIGYYLERLQLIDDVHRSLASSISLDELLRLILDRLFEHLRPEEGVIFLARDNGTYERVAERRPPGLEAKTLYSRTLIEEVAGKRQAALVLDAQTDERFAGAESIMASAVRSIVAAPLVVDDESFGMIAMSSHTDVRKFEERDLELLGSLASVAAHRLRNVSLAVEAAERRKLEAEVALARSIQETLLEQRVPAVPGYDVFGVNRPSQGVSGDLYQVLATDSENDFFLFLFDVSGKGLAASLLTATIEALCANPIARNLSPDRIFVRVNNQLERRTPSDRFATAFLARLNTETGVLTYASAGHNPVLLVRAAGGVERLMRTGLPLAVMAGSEYSAIEVELGDGDLLAIYSDGLTEATNPNGEEYGLERLEAVCVAAVGSEAAEVARLIEESIAAFTAGTPYADDRTLLVMRRGTPQA